MSEDITAYVHRATLDMISKFSRELIETFKECLDKNDTPFEELTFTYDTTGVTTALFNNKPLLRWTNPVVELGPKSTGSITYKWTIWKVE